MLTLLIGISIVVSMLLIPSLALVMMRKKRNIRDDVPRSMRDGVRVLATITDVQIRQEWKVGKRWERSPWDGHLVRQKTWQISYDVTAQWMHARTKQLYIFRSKIWSDDVAKTPTLGQTAVFIVNLRHPECSTADPQSFS
jgi:multidrug efflux pump subunit AcrB